MGETTDRAALVFGGSRGIGAAIVERLAQDGHKVAFTYVSGVAPALQIVEQLQAQGHRVLAIQADSANPDQLRAAVAKAVEQFGTLDVVVVNAGVYRYGAVDQLDLADLDRLIDVNVRGAYLAIQATAPHLRDGGRVITIGSNTALHTGSPGSSAYQMTKGAVAAMVKGVALDLAPRGITVNNIQPGPTETDITVGVTDYLAARNPLKRVAKPGEIAGLVAYVARDEAGYMTGASLTIDGGFTL